MSKIVNLTKEEILEFFERCESLRQIFAELGVNSNGSGSYRTFKKHCKKLGVEIPKFKKFYNYPRNTAKYTLDEILVENSTYSNSDRLKKRLIKEELMEYKCNECDIKKWNGKYIALHLEHKNGIHNDNRLENLELLCPNCHSQTKTYAGRNVDKERIIKFDINVILNSNIDFSKEGWVKEVSKLTGLTPKYIRKFLKKESPKFYKEKCSEYKQLRKVKNRPSKEELEKMLKETNYSAVGRVYGVSDNAVRKWAKAYNIL